MGKPAKHSARKVKAIGWFDLADLDLDATSPPAEGYAACLVGPATIEGLVPSEWRDTVALSRCIVNEGYDLEEKISSEVFVGGCDQVVWSDARSASRFAADFMEARRLFSEALTKRDASGRVLIDATAVSKTMLSAVVGMLIRTRAVAGIDVLYRQMEYAYQGRKLEQVYAEGPMSHGINDIAFGYTAIPYVEGKYKPGMRRHIVLLCGLDFQRTLSKVRELEPARIDIIAESEALLDPVNAATFKRMCKHLEVESTRISHVSRRDAVGALELIDEAITSGEQQGLHSIIVSSGGKPFALVGALHSVLRSECPMLATIPDRVVMLSRKCAGAYRVYRLTDRTALI